MRATCRALGDQLRLRGFAKAGPVLLLRSVCDAVCLDGLIRSVVLSTRHRLSRGRTGEGRGVVVGRAIDVKVLGGSLVCVLLRASNRGGGVLFRRVCRSVDGGLIPVHPSQRCAEAGKRLTKGCSGARGETC